MWLASITAEEEDAERRARALAQALLSLPQPPTPAATRALAAQHGVLCPEFPADRGGHGAGLLGAMAGAHALGLALPRSLSAAVVDAVIPRLSLLSDRVAAPLTLMGSGELPVALMDATAMDLRLERRPGSGPRLCGEIPHALAPADAKYLAIIFEDRPESFSLVVLPASHLAMRATPLSGLPLVSMQGMVDAEVREEHLVADAHSEVLRALAAEQLVRASRTLGEWQSLASPLHAAGGGPTLPALPAGLSTVPPTSLPVAERGGVWRNVLRACADRLTQPGPHTLLGEEARQVGQGAALEARALAHAVLAEVADAAADLCALSQGTGLQAQVEECVWVWRLDAVAWSGPVWPRRPVPRLGESRLGVLAGSRRTQPPPARPSDAADAADRRPSASARQPTGRLMAASAELGPLPALPAPLQPRLIPLRRLTLDVLEPAAAALDPARPLAGWDLITAHRDALGLAGVDDALSLLWPLAVAEELGRLPAGLAAALHGTALTGFALRQCPDSPARVGALAAWSAAGTPAILAEEPLGASPAEDGRWRLSGDTVAVGLTEARLMLTAAVQAPGDGLSLVLAQVPPESVTYVTPPRPAMHDAGTVLSVRLEDVAASHAGPLCSAEQAEALLGRILAAERLMWAARASGLATAALEHWRAALNGAPEATRHSQTGALGQAWARLAMVRARLWETAVALQSGAEVFEDARAACRAAVALSRHAAARAADAQGADAVARPGRVREHLRAAAVMAALAR